LGPRIAALAGADFSGPIVTRTIDDVELPLRNDERPRRSEPTRPSATRSRRDDAPRGDAGSGTAERPAEPRPAKKGFKGRATRGGRIAPDRGRGGPRGAGGGRPGKGAPDT